VEKNRHFKKGFESSAMDGNVALKHIKQILKNFYLLFKNVF